MALIEAHPLSLRQQEVVDGALRKILGEWADLVYGEFEASFGDYQVTIVKREQGVDGGVPQAVVSWGARSF